MSGLRLLLLGPPRLERDGVPLKLDRRKAVALLAYLAVMGKAHSRETLATLFWPDFDHSRGRASLRRVLAALNKALGGGWLVADREKVELDRSAKRSVWLDVEQFQGRLSECEIHGHPTSEVCPACLTPLTEAVALYRGDFLAGFTLSDSPEFDEWQLFQTEHLRREMTQALERLVRCHSAQEEFELAISYARRWPRLDPLHEPAHRQMMRLLTRNGQRNAALAQYDTCRQVLAKELGVEPEAETTALYERIRAGKLDREILFSTPQPPSSPAPPAPPPFLSSAPPHAYTPAPFVVRERELAQLDGFLDLALTGQGRVVFVTGEAGSGKTALIQEFARRAQETRADLVVASGSCNAHTGIGDPYLPFREVLGLLTGDVEARWNAGAIDREQARRLWALIPHSVQALASTGPDLIDIFIPSLALVTRAATVAPGGAGWLVPLEGLVAQKEADQGRADVRQSDLFEQYTKVLQALTQEGPLLLVLDDLQWADAGSISLLFHLGRRLESSRILVVGIYRPADVAMGRDGERHPLEPVVSEFQRHFGPIRVDLEQTESQRFVEALLETEPNRLSVGFREALYQQTRGHALFTVEMLRGLQERGDLVKDEADRWLEGPAVDWEALPARVEGVIGERIGRLPTRLQEALKVASVEGESFTAEVVARVQAVDEREIVRQLSSELDKQHRLVRGQGSQRLGGQRLSHYRFRHILFQRYLYNSLDEVERTYFHEAVGNVLEQLYEGQTEGVAVQLARHFQVAGLVVKAVDYLRQAGERAVRLSANEEAIGHFTKALGLLETLPDTPERTQQELTLQIALSAPLVMIKGYGAPEVEQVYARARELCQQVGETSQLFPVLRGLCNCYSNRAELRRAQALGEQLLSLAQGAEDPVLLMQAHWMLGENFFFLGEMATARAHLEQGIALYDPQRYRSHPFRAVQDPGMACRQFAARALWFLGYPDQALKRINEALTLAQELSHPISLVHTLQTSMGLHQFRGEGQIAQERAEDWIALATEKGLDPQLPGWTMRRGWRLVEQGEIEEGISLMRQGLDAWRAMGTSVVWRPYHQGRLAEAYLKAGQAEEGLRVLTEALAIVDKSEKHFYEAELYRLKGELLLKQAEADEEAEKYFRQAIDIARQQGAKSLELRAVMSLSRLWQEQGKKEEARQMLAEIYDWFTEGFDTGDLREAKALLEELS